MASAATIGILRAMMLMDTSNFDAGARKTSKGTKGLEKDIEGLTKEVAKLTPQAERMVKAFGGDRLLHQANNLTAAVNKLGGAQKLTAAEQTKVNRTLTDALEKYKALGQKAPAEMVKLEAATRKTADGTGALNTRMVALGAAAGNMAAEFAGRALRAVINMGRAAVDSAGMILDLSKSTGLSTKTIQQMQFVAEQTGSSLETFTGAAFRLGMRLSGGGDSVKKAVEALGLEFQKVRAMKPDQQWDVITAALGRMEDAQKRNELGVVLMGKTFAGVATAIADDYRKVADEATLSSDEQIRALEKAGDAWDKFKNRQHTNVRSILGDIVVLGTEFQKAGFFEKLAALGSGIGAGPNAVAGLFTKSLNVGAKPPAAPGAAPAPVVPTDYVKQIAAIRAELALLKPDEIVRLNAAIELGVKSATELEDEFGLSEGALRLYNAAAKEGATRTKELEKDSKALAKSQAELAKETENAARAWLDMLGKMERDELQRVADARRADVLADIGFQMAGIEGVVDRAVEARDKLDERDAKWRAHRNEMGERMLEEEGARIAKAEARWQQYYQTVANIFLGLVDAAAGNLGTLIFGTGADNGAQQAAEDAAESYERLKASGVASAEAITRAFQDMRRAEAAAQDSFADRLKSVWDGIRRYLVDVLNQILNYFVHQFLAGMIKAIVASKLSQTLGQAIVGGVSAGVGGGGGIVGSVAQTAGGVILPNVVGGGAAAGGVLASSSIAGASAASIPAIASAGSSVSLAAGTSAGAVGGGGAGGLGMIGALASNPITWGVAAGLLLTWGIKEKGWFRGGEEGVKVNPRRGRFIGQFGPPGTGPESGFHTLAAILTSITKKPGGGPAMAALNAADTVREFESAQATIVGILGRNGRNVKSFNMGGFVAPGAVVPAVLHGGRFGEVITPLRAPAAEGQSPRVVHHHQINITSWDALDVRRGMKQIIKELKFEAQTNENGLVPAFSRAQGLA